MLEDTATSPSIWSSMNSWFTPTVLFVLLNLMIGTILFTSNLPSQNHQQKDEKSSQNGDQQQQNPQPKMARSPSVLERLKSLNLYNHRSQDSEKSQQVFEQIPYSDTHLDFEQTHFHQTLETAATQYVFDHVQEPQENIGTATHYVFEPAHQEKSLVSDNHFGFTEEKSLFSNNHFGFEEKHNQYVYEQENTSVQNSDFDFTQPQEERSTLSDTLLDLSQTHEENFDKENENVKSLDEVYSQLTSRHVNRTKSDTKPASGEVPEKLPSKMRKSASVKSAFNHFEEEDIVEARRPATVRERRKAKATENDDGGGGEVDAKADDFINKFRQQLKLQRIDSIIRYKDMIGRGSAK